ncbi:MAG: SsrA-binding protein SmpB [Bacteroidota bacterium]
MKKDIVIKNKKASYQYEFIDQYVAGIQLTGTEIKSIRQGKASMVDTYCYFRGNELFLKGMHIAEYEYGTYANHEPKRERKLLLTRKELKKLKKAGQEKGLTIVATRLFINERGLAKVNIALAKGKKLHDKREDIKKKDMERSMERGGKL